MFLVIALLHFVKYFQHSAKLLHCMLCFVCQKTPPLLSVISNFNLKNLCNDIICCCVFHKIIIKTISTVPKRTYIKSLKFVIRVGWFYGFRYYVICCLQNVLHIRRFLHNNNSSIRTDSNNCSIIFINYCNIFSWRIGCLSCRRGSIYI